MQPPAAIESNVLTTTTSLSTNGASTLQRSSGSSGFSKETFAKSRAKSGQCVESDCSNGASIPNDLPDPFRYELRPTWTERLMIALMLVTVAPVRALLVAICLAFAWLFAVIAISGLPVICEQPLHSWRKLLKKVVVHCVRAAWFFAGVHWVTVKGVRVSSAVAPILVMAPHSSLVDSLAGAKCGFPGVVSVIENAHIPVIGTLFRVNESIFVTRSDADSRQQTVKEILRRARSVEPGGAVWPQLIIFPEGTCTNRTCLLPFKTGAFIAGVPVQPVCIRYPIKLDVISWINIGPGILAMMFLLLCRPHTTMEMEYLPVYQPSEEERHNPQLFAENLRQLMSRHMGMPTTDRTYEDLTKMQKACKPDRSPLTAFKRLFLDGFISMPRYPPGKEQ